MLGLAFWAIQGGLLAIMVVMTVRGEQKHQAERQRDRLHVERPAPLPSLGIDLVGFTPRQRARLFALRDSVRAAQNGIGALKDDIRAV
ncbi:MAG: hypothetical protein JO023_12565 [Chloroflexi bacterium]|nr:hypothetical protein [Chloroflexota bacterium]